MTKTFTKSIFALIALFCLIALPQQALAKPAKGKAEKTTQQVEKEKLVLMPLRVPDEDKSLTGAMETALVKGLQQKYDVFSGEQVSQKAREIFMKESRNTAHKECDETKCMQNIAMAFQAELIATANITKQAGGYFIALSIQNIFDNKVVQSESVACKGCDSFAVVDKLKELVVGTDVATKAVKAVPQNTSLVAASPSGNNAALNISCSGEDTGAEVWVNDKLRGECPVELKVLSGTIKLKVVKAVDAEHERVQEQEVKVFEDSVKRVDAKLSLQLSAQGLAKEAAAKEKASLERIAILPSLIPKIEENMVSIPNKSFAIGKYDVTQGEWEAVMGNNPSRFTSCGDNCPVEQVSWNDVQEFLQKLNAKTGKQYRLPTEEEWEYACYGGNKTEFCGSNDINSVAWWRGNSNETKHPVGQKQANDYGLYDMSGNVWQWMQDKWDNVHDWRVVRGGSWDSSDWHFVRAAHRDGLVPALRLSGNGFRLARTLP